MNAKEYDVAVLRYTTALSLNPATLQDLLGKRSKAHVGKGEWEEALRDANEVTHFNSSEFLHAHGCTQVIELDPSSPLGYERKHEALRGIGRYVDAAETFEVMLLKMSESSDPEIRGEGDNVTDVVLLTSSHRTIPPLYQARKNERNDSYNYPGYHS